MVHPHLLYIFILLSVKENISNKYLQKITNKKVNKQIDQLDTHTEVTEHSGTLLCPGLATELSSNDLVRFSTWMSLRLAVRLVESQGIAATSSSLTAGSLTQVSTGWLSVTPLWDQTVLYSGLAISTTSSLAITSLGKKAM